MKWTENIEVFNEDCMVTMARYPDNYFDLAIVDPPYGIDVGNMRLGLGKGKKCSKEKNRNWSKKDWDKSIPDKSYFEELFRVSKNQIIWGGNYFPLPNSNYFAIWDKGEGIYGRSFAECEYAWVRSGGTRIHKINPVQKDRIHPTQKPRTLYKWLLKNYAKPDFKILDTHLGSGNHAVEAHYFNVSEFIGCELEKQYFDKGNKYFKEQTSQLAIF